MRFVCDSCRAQYMISDDKIGAKGVKVRCKKCGYVITVRTSGATASKDDAQGAAEAGSAEGKGKADVAVAGIPASVGTPPEGGLFTDVEEDEIGAVFDSVLNSGSHKIPAGEPVGDEAGAKATDSVLKLAEEEEGEPKPPASSHEWFVAIDEKQVGPLTVEKVKDHWERGEVGPDSLCWRSGFSDWIPLSEVTELASELSPRPASKPVIVVPAAVTSSAPVASAPVESAFSAGNASKSSRAESPLATSSSVGEPGTGWKPSAASVLASLVQEEDEALSRPAPRAEPVAETKPRSTGLLDLPPPEPTQAPAPMAAMPAPAPVMVPPPAAPAPYAPPAPQYAQPAPQYAQPAPQYAQPGYPAYPPPAAPPPSGNKMGPILGAVAALVLVSIGGGVVYMMTRPPAPVAPTGAVAAVTPTAEPVQPTTPKPAEALPMPPPPAAVAQTPPAGTAPATGTQQPATPPPAQGTAVAATGTQTPPPATAPTPELVKPAEPPKTTTARVEPTTPKKATNTGSRSNSGETEAPPKVAHNEPRAKPDVSDDEFDELFGTKKPAKREEPVETKRPATYIPPEPGTTTKVPERLAQSDVMQVVLNNKPAIVKCVNEQKKKDPSISGKLVMKWTIQTSGRTSAIACQSSEFKSTYMAKCIGDLIKSWSFPKHQKQGDPIVFPFTF